MRKKAVIIINPVAGKARAKNNLFNIVQTLNQHDYETIVHVTSCKGDATVASEHYAGLCDLIVCCGGDGTLNEVISGILRSEKRPPLCYYPCGTTNDFASTVGLPKFTSQKQITTIADRNTTLLDVGKFNKDMHFSYIASFGIFTKASYSTDQTMKNYLGHLAYLLEGTKELPDIFKSYRIRLEYAGGVIEDSFIFGAVANATSIGGVLKLPPEKVTLDDGLFEILLIKAPQNALETQSLISMLSQSKFDGKQIILLQSPFAKIYAASPIAWCTDGEFAGDFSTVEITNLNKALNIVV